MRPLLSLPGFSVFFLLLHSFFYILLSSFVYANITSCIRMDGKHEYFSTATHPQTVAAFFVCRIIVVVGWLAGRVGKGVRWKCWYEECFTCAPT